MREIIHYLLCGMAMGAADVVPGVSGGTIAFITGIYGQLLSAIKSFDLAFFKLFFRGKFREALGRIPWAFLIPLLCGVGLSIFSLAKLVLWLLAEYPVVIWSFFFGLILASIVLLFKSILLVKSSIPGLAAAFCAGIALAVLLTTMEPFEMSHGFAGLFIAGFIAICAMILPGISGAFMLVLMGQYQLILSAVSALQFSTLAVFACGCICGLLSFARLLSACLNLYYSETLTVLTGVMAGSLHVIWPFRADGAPALPHSLTGEVWISLLFCLAGLLLPVALHALAGRRERADSGNKTSGQMYS